MNNEPMSAADIISKVFENIDKSNLENSNALFNAWRETLKKVNNYGEKLVAHTRIIDLKNHTLLVETDHPGWTQILQMHENFIIRGLNWKVSELGVKNLMIRLEGSDANFYNSYQQEKENATEILKTNSYLGEKSSDNLGTFSDEKNKSAEKNLIPKSLPKKKLESCKNDSSVETDYANKLPKEILKKFENIKKSIEKN